MAAVGDKMTPEQIQHAQFKQLYAVEKKPLRAAAAECGLDIITATMLAQQTGCLRFTEAVIVNSKAGEQGRMGEDLFQQLLPEAINCNTSIRYANPAYDFLLDGLRIDIKCSAGMQTKGKRLFPFNLGNTGKKDLLVCFVKSEADTPNKPESYQHAFIMPSLFLIQMNSKTEIRAEAIHDKKFAYHEYCYPIENVAETVRKIAANKEMFAIPEELKQAANAHRQLKKEVNNVKRNRNRKTA